MYLKSLYVYYLTKQFKYYLNFLFLFVPFRFKKQTKCNLINYKRKIIKLETIITIPTNNKQ